LNSPEVDEYIDDIRESLGKPINRDSDKMLAKAHSRVSNVIGPLGRLWANMKKIRTKESEVELDLFGCLRLVKQLSSTMLGQAK